MATFTPTLTLTTLGLTSNDLSFSVSTSPTVTDTTGLQRTTLNSTSKVTKLSVLVGDADVADATTVEGQYIDITDNHGLRRRYVFTTADAGGSASNVIIVTGTDLGSGTAGALNREDLFGGVTVQITNGDEQRDILEKLRVVINDTNGHAGSITAAAVASEAAEVQSTTLTNPVTGESGVFLIDAKNSTWIHVSNPTVATSTNSGVDHPTLLDKNELLAPAFVYIKNTAAYHATAGRVFCYYDNHGAEDIMEIRGGHFAFISLSPNNNLKAYTSTAGTIVEYMVIGDDA